VRRRVGGSRRTQHERQPAMERFWREAGPAVEGDHRHQCRCGSTAARPYRRAWWCEWCGRESQPLDPEGIAKPNGCPLCRAMEPLTVVTSRP